VAAVKGTLSKLIFSIGLHHLRRLLELVGLTMCQERNVLVFILGTAVCLQAVAVAFCKICDFVRDHDAAFHKMYVGTVVVHVFRRKQETARKGLYASVKLASWLHGMSSRVSGVAWRRVSLLPTLLLLYCVRRTGRNAEQAAGYAGRDQEPGAD
jgi:NADH:ubiquinone oxidoreductase subunit K